MKKQYTRKQIQEAISYWKGKLRRMSESYDINKAYVINSHYEYSDSPSEGAGIDAEIPYFDDNEQPIRLIEKLENGIADSDVCVLTTVSIYEWNTDRRGQKLSANEASEVYENLRKESGSMMKPKKYI